MPDAQANQSDIPTTPVKGYSQQTTETLAMVNHNKEIEETILRLLDGFKLLPELDQRWLAIGRTHIETGFMAVNRAIFKPERVEI